MNDIEWKVLREDYLENLGLKVALYAPTRCATITIPNMTYEIGTLHMTKCHAVSLLLKRRLMS